MTAPTLDTLLADVRRAAVRAHEGATSDERSDGYVDLDTACADLLRACWPGEDDATDHLRQHADRRLYERACE